jgi:hypothetical protein
MPSIRATASALVPSPPGAVYAILADYRNGHPRILPPKYLSSLEVERGGVGAGTVIRFRLHGFGPTREVRAEITEPEPGRVLEERDVETGAVTRFTVEPESDGRRCRVTITTEWSTPGLRGHVERLLAPPLLRRVYAEELERLTEVAAGSSTASQIS